MTHPLRPQVRQHAHQYASQQARPPAGMLARLIASAFATALASLLPLAPAQAAVDLIAVGSLSQATDLSGLTGLLENGIDRSNALGGIGSGLAWAGGNSFLALPDRGPNATAWNSAVDNTTSYIGRWQSLSLALSVNPGGALPYALTPQLTATTLLYSPSALNYGAVTPGINSAGRSYFDGRSDNFAAGLSSNPANARFDPEGLRVANDGRSVFISDEYGPYVYQFDRSTGQRLRSLALPANLAIGNLSASGSAEISGNASGRVANKGMEGLAISPDGQTLYGFMQSPLAQDGGDGGRYNRILKTDIGSGAVQQYAYDNRIGIKNYNSSELLAINDHQFLVLERDGKGLGDGSPAVVKQLRLVDLAGATEVSGLSGAASLAAVARNGSLFLDIKADLVSKHGYADTAVPAKLEGAAFGADIVEGGISYHTLYLANDNDFVPGVAGVNQFFVYRFTDADLVAAGGSALVNQNISAVPEPGAWAMMLAGLAGAASLSRRRAQPAA